MDASADSGVVVVNGRLPESQLDDEKKNGVGFDGVTIVIDPHFTKLDMDKSSMRGDDEEEETEKKVDKFDVTMLDIADTGPAWSDMSNAQRTGRVLMMIGGVSCALGLLYIFICSLDVLTSSFQLLAGRVASDAFSNSSVLNNPIAGLVLGVLVTVLLQSSSTSTSIVVSLVGSGVLGVEQAIYIIMGANIGTSVTNTIVSLTQSTDKETFRRSFAGATVHDLFNWLTVLVLLPLEAASGYLYHLTYAIVKNINPSGNGDDPQFLKVITTPLTNKIVKVDKGVLNAQAEGSDLKKYPICKYYCDTDYENYLQSWPLGQENETFVQAIHDMPWTVDVTLQNDTDQWLTNLTWRDLTNQSETCTHKFTGCGGVEGTWCSLSDEAVGGILLACSLTVLMTSIIIMVKILNLILSGPMAKAVRAGINAEFPGKAKFLTGYVAILMGAGMTMLLQSSSVFTSSITPLVGMGLVSVERMFPLTLGANIGTCLTGILAALTAEPEMIQDTLQVSLAHLFFNITGIILCYPIPFTRNLPIRGAKFMGNTTAEYRWFALAYVILVFLLIPGAIFGLSLLGWQVLVGVLVPIAAVVIAVVVVNVMQSRCSQKMHPRMRTWDWLPKPLRSLAPCNSVIMKCCYTDKCIACRKKCLCSKDEEDSDSDDDSMSSSSSGSSNVKAPPYGIYISNDPYAYTLSHLPNGIQAPNIEGHSNPSFVGDCAEITQL